MARRCGEAWIGARCEYCGAEWTRESKGHPLRYDIEDDSIVCSLGRGCSQRRPEDQKRGFARLSSGRLFPVPLYLHEGVWYSCPELAALADVPYHTMRARLQNGWTVRDALKPPASIAKEDESQYKKLLGIALARAGGTPLQVAKSADSKPGRPGRWPGISAAAREVGISVAAMVARCQRLGSLEAAVALGPSARQRAGKAAA